VYRKNRIVMKSEDSTTHSSPELSLSDLVPGEAGDVIRLEVEGEQRRRLMDLGLVPGTTVSVAFRSPLGDPASYQIRGALIALRDVQARQIIIRRTSLVDSEGK
jgi:ferrous iron transport protein A